MSRSIYLFLFILLSNSLAFGLPPKPDKCPTTNSIKAAGLMSAEWDAVDNMYIAGQVNSYDTPTVNWAFAISIPNKAAVSVDDALIKARAVLPSLTGIPVPVAYEDKWICMYNDLTGGFKAIAITPFSLASVRSPALKVK